MSQQKTPISSQALKQQRQEADARLANLRQQQVDAIEQGLEFEHNNEILIVSERTAALDKAIERALKRETDEEDRLERAEARDDILKMKSEWQEGVEEHLSLLAQAEAALKEAGRLFAAIEERADGMYRKGSMIRNFLLRHGRPADEPGNFSLPNLHMRLGEYASHTLSASPRSKDSGSRIGSLSWSNVHPSGQSWPDVERAALAPPSAALLKGLDQVFAKLQEPEDAPAAHPSRIASVMAALEKCPDGEG